jgi:hypothetical protein
MRWDYSLVPRNQTGHYFLLLLAYDMPAMQLLAAWSIKIKLWEDQRACPAG